jgi:tetratricopeptide (TPR) repeat protein
VNRIALFTRDQATAAPPPADGNAYRYWAFLSYSHADTKAADRLHRFLERFRLPDSLVGRDHPLGTIPKRLTPIFRDRHELAASSSLGREIEEALLASRYLIVLCSPAAAKSRWVDQEIRDYKRLHGEDRVLAAIVAGEPFSEGEDECFPPALRHRVGRDGKLTRQKVEPVAADLREDRDGQRIGSLKIAAGMLEVGLDDLVQRDQQRRQKRLTWMVAASLLGMAFTTALSVVAINARDAAREERRQAEGLVGFLLGDLKDQLEPIGRLDALDQVGARALAYYERQDKSDLTDDQLAQRSKALTLLGQIATSRGDTDGALARYREALRSTAELVQRSPSDPQRLFDHAQNVFWMGELARGRGRMDLAEAYYRQYGALANRMVAAEPDNLKWQMEALYAKENIGIVLFYQRRFGEAANEISQAMPIMERLAAKEPDNAEYQREFSNVLAWLADAQKNEGRLQAAIGARERQIELLEARFRAGSKDVTLREKILPARLALGMLYMETSRLSQATRQFEMAIAEADSLNAIEPENATWRGYAASGHLELAGALLNRRRIALAEQEAAVGCSLVANLRRRDPNLSTWRASETVCHVTQARLALVRGAAESALAAARNAVASARQEQSADAIRQRYNIASGHLLEGEALMRLGNRQQALQVWEAALKQLPPDVTERPREMSERAGLLRRLGRNREATLLQRKLADMGFRQVS